MTQYDDYGVPVGAYQEPEGLAHQTWRTARAVYLYRIRPLVGEGYRLLRRQDWSFRRWFTLANVLVVLWWMVLYWGERGVFNGNIDSCSWDKWENWVRFTSYMDLRSNILLTGAPGSRRKPPQTHIRRGPAAHRSAHVPWPPMAH